MITKTGIHVDESSSFTNPLVYEENGQVNSIVADSLTPDTRYYTRGYVISDGTTVYSQNTKSFKTAAPDYLVFANPDWSNDITLTLTKIGSPTGIKLETSLNDGSNWTAVDMTGVTSQSFLIPAGKKLIFRGDNGTFSTGANNYYQFQCQSDILVGGNIMTLIDRTGLSLVIPNTYCFYSLFKGMNTLENSGLSLPATTLKEYCYAHIFDGCSLMTTPPELPATELAVGCYQYAFNACSALSYSPELPAKDIANYAYLNMFNGARALKMITVFATSWNTANAAGWVQNAGDGAGDFYNLGGATIPVGNNGIPTGWTEYNSI